MTLLIEAFTVLSDGYELVNKLVVISPSIPPLKEMRGK